MMFSPKLPLLLLTGYLNKGISYVADKKVASKSLILNFTEIDIWPERPSILGGVGGRNTSTVTGVWHTNEDTPAYEGAIIAHR